MQLAVQLAVLLAVELAVELTVEMAVERTVQLAVQLAVQLPVQLRHYPKPVAKMQSDNMSENAAFKLQLSLANHGRHRHIVNNLSCSCPLLNL